MKYVIRKILGNFQQFSTQNITHQRDQFFLHIEPKFSPDNSLFVSANHYLSPSTPHTNFIIHTLRVLIGGGGQENEIYYNL